MDLSLLIKPASGNCNMRCSYCFYADVTNSRKVKNRGMMSIQTLEIIVRRALSEAGKSCAFGFQGGEPTLAGLDFYKELIALQDKYNVNHVRIHNTIQTNGLLIDEQWADFFARHDFLVGLSIDGDRKVHDAVRPDTKKRETFSYSMRAAKLMEQRGGQFNILTVLTRFSAAHPDKLYKFYKRNHFAYIQLIPCLDGLGETHGSNPYSLDAKTYGRFLKRIFDLWYTDFIAGDYTSIRTFDNYVHMLTGKPPENCAMNGRCQGYPVIEADGSVYPCDFYVLDQYRIGDVKTDSFEQMLCSKLIEDFIVPSLAVQEECSRCKYGFICRGGCRRDRTPTPDGQLALNYYCDAYRVFFDHALERMADVARKMRHYSD